MCKTQINYPQMTGWVWAKYRLINIQLSYLEKTGWERKIRWEVYFQYLSFSKMSLSSVCMLSLSRVQLFVTPKDCSPPGSSVHGILQARTLERVAMPSSRGSSPPRDWTHVSTSCALSGGFFATKPPGKPWVCPLLQTKSVICCVWTHRPLGSKI